MIAAFSTKINGKLTYFVEKIHSGLLQNNMLQGFDLGYEHEFDLGVLSGCEPKIHTIREDKNNRWKPGVMIDFFINARTKAMFRFAPRLPVVSTQTVKIIYVPYTIPRYRIEPVVWIDGKVKRDMAGIMDDTFLEFVQNDGFDTIEDFFAYFNTNFEGKLIHWTDKKY